LEQDDAVFNIARPEDLMCGISLRPDATPPALGPGLDRKPVKSLQKKKKSGATMTGQVASRVAAGDLPGHQEPPALIESKEEFVSRTAAEALLEMKARDRKTDQAIQDASTPKTWANFTYSQKQQMKRKEREQPPGEDRKSQVLDPTFAKDQRDQQTRVSS
jgi:hypothetical protein